MNILEHLIKVKNEINTQFKDSFLNKVQLISNENLLLCFSKGKEKSLLISTNLACPFVKVTDKKFNLNCTSNFFQILKSKISNAHFIEAKILNDDNILALEFIKTTDTYDRLNLTLVIELFKSNANIILLNGSMVLCANKYKGLDTNHPILINLKYEFPTKTPSFKEFDQIEKNKIETYFNDIENKFLKEKYKQLILLLKRKNKSLLKKVDKLSEENNSAKEKLKYKDYGDYLKMNLSNIKRGDSKFAVDNIEIKLNPTLSPTQNLERFYKLYRKSKLTIEATEKYIKQTLNEIDYIQNIINSINSFGEQEYEELIFELSQNKVIKINSRKNQKQLTAAAKPYYVHFKNIKIGYGKNNIQNNELTFRYAKENLYFLHILNNHGPHIVIFDPNPSDEVIQFACELALYLCNHQDGDVAFALIKNIKKTSTLGLVKLNKYESYHINNIRENMKDFVDNSNRF